MPSPFPGMNPYFEQAAVWQDFHSEFLSTLRRQLAPRIAPEYIVPLEEHVYIHDLPPEPRQRIGRADLSVSRPESERVKPAGIDLLEAPAEVHLPAQDVERVPFLEVRDRRGRELVTVIEVLSPSNKRAGEDREPYLAKRRELLRSPAHLVEIELLRGWNPMPADNRPEGTFAYSVLISRSERSPAADFWPIGLRDRLPVIPIPLKRPDEAAKVDLQAVLHGTYDGPGYEHFLHEGEPEPPLRGEDVSWVQSLTPGMHHD
ncbi:MAG TPA: DUF4058 family protein [Isosphaeraceae bacterium]|nr:DUF4058 family protein [Isosphaeraceae bacterium]